MRQEGHASIPADPQVRAVACASADDKRANQASAKRDCRSIILGWNHRCRMLPRNQEQGMTLDEYLEETVGRSLGG